MFNTGRVLHKIGSHVRKDIIEHISTKTNPKSFSHIRAEAMPLRCSGEAAGVAQPLLDLCSTLAQPLLNPCSTLAQLLLNPYSTLAQPLLNPCSTLAQPLLDPCSTPAQPLLDPYPFLSNLHPFSIFYFFHFLFFPF